MSNLETKISELERELALKKGYQAVTFKLPKGTPDDVAEEIQAKLREIANGLALSREELSGGATIAASVFTAEEVASLKMIAETVAKKVNAQLVVDVKTYTGSEASVRNNDHVPKPSNTSPRKAKIVTSENVRGEGRRYAAADDEIYVANPDKVDAHGMVSATHMKRGAMLKIPLDDIDFIE